MRLCQWCIVLTCFSTFASPGSGQDDAAWRRSIETCFEKEDYRGVLTLFEAHAHTSSQSDSNALVIGRVAKSYFLMGDNLKSQQIYRDVNSRSIADSAIHALLLCDYSQVLLELGEYSQADSTLMIAIASINVSAQPSLYSRWLSFQGILFLHTSRYDAALRTFDEAIKIAKRVNDIHRISYVLSSMGIAYRQIGNSESAVRVYRQSLEIDSKLNRRVDMAADYVNLGNIYNELSDLNRAVECYDKADTLYLEIGDSSGVSMVLGNLSEVHIAQGQLEEAKVCLESAIRLSRRAHDIEGEASWLLSLGKVEAKNGNTENALRDLSESKRLFSELSNIPSLAESLVEVGIVLNELGRPKESEEVLLDALAKLKRYNLESHIWKPIYRLARLTETVGDWKKSDSLYTAAIGSIENVRKSISDKNLTTYFFEEGRLEVYRYYTCFLLHHGNTQKAFDILESAKSQNLKERLSGPTFESNLKTPKQQIILEYFLFDTSTYVFLKSSESLTCTKIGAPLRIHRLAGELFTIMKPSADQEALRKLLNALYHELIDPIRHDIRGHKDLVIVPDGVTYYLPFEAFHDGNSFMTESFSISYAPSLGIFRRLSEKRYRAIEKVKLITQSDYEGCTDIYSGKILPSLHSVRDEEKNLLETCRRKNIRVDRAVRSVTDWGSYDLIHVATHGINHATIPGLSSLIVKDSLSCHYITADEIEHFKLNSDLVTLSACQTSLGQLLQGEGMLGLTRAFLIAGSSSVISSLWNIDDEGSAYFMKNFYEIWLSSKLDKRDALRRTKIKLLNESVSPCFWAPFILWGSGQ